MSWICCDEHLTVVAIFAARVMQGASKMPPSTEYSHPQTSLCWQQIKHTVEQKQACIKPGHHITWRTRETKDAGTGYTMATFSRSG